jgi:hypothetical protein
MGVLIRTWACILPAVATWFLAPMTLLLLPPPTVAGEELRTLAIASEQRMLSQRIAKAYVQLGLNVQPLAARSQLAAAIRSFEANQQLIAASLSAHPDAARAYELLARGWEAMRPLVAGTPTLANAQRLTQHAETVLNAAEMLVNVYADRAGTDEHRVLRLIARQRMLSQRIAKAYLLRSWGDRSAQLRHESEDAMAAFDGVLLQFQARRDDPPLIRQELDELVLQWEWLKAAMDSDGALSYRLVVAEAADAILEHAERLTRHYQQLLAAK